MTAFLLRYPAFDRGAVEPIYLRPAVIAVKVGNPKGIEGFEELLADGMRIVVTEGAGVYDTSGTGVWEDMNVVVSPEADPEAPDFLDFLISEEAQTIMATEGWRR